MVKHIFSDGGKKKTTFSPVYIIHHQVQLSNTFDNATKIHCVLTGIIKAGGSLLTFALIVDLLVPILKGMCYAFDRTLNSHTAEVILVFNLPHLFQRQFKQCITCI